MRLSEKILEIVENIDDLQPQIPVDSKNTLLLAAKALRIVEVSRDDLPAVATCPDCNADFIDHDGFGFCGCAEAARLDREQRDRIKDLEAIVSRLPHTADGVPVVPGDEVWHPDYLWRSWEVDYDGDAFEYTVAINPDRKGNEWDEAYVSDCYSTPQAAEKASKQ